MATIINMTPHPITILDAAGKVVREIPASGKTIRLESGTVPGSAIDGIPTSNTFFSDPVGLPEFEEGVFYIVSQLVKNALSWRTDLLVPAEMVRNEAGHIIGCKSLGR